MQINADFDVRAVAHAAETPWVPSPMAGVERRMLDRIGTEVARATSIVRYAPGSVFSAHVHDGGEEFLVLEGVFQDEHGDYPAGTYVRNPPTSSHTPASKDGCVILVKLWQFDLDDRTPVRIETSKTEPTVDAARPGVATIPLYNDSREDVRVECWPPNADVAVDGAGGAEVFVIEGAYSADGEAFERHSWLRTPVGDTVVCKAGPDGARLWIKSGHLAHRRSTPPGAKILS